MKKFKKLCTVLAMATATASAFAIPAKPGVVKDLVQPDGTVVKATIVGDEYGHYYATSDNFPLVKNSVGAYCYAVLSENGTIVPSKFEARNVEMRGSVVQSFLDGISIKEVSAKLLQPAALKRSSAESHRKALAAARPNAPVAEDGYSNPAWQLGLMNALCPHDGERHNLVILVEYTDQKFSMENPNEYFEEFLNKEGFNKNGAFGSVRDYFVTASMGQYQPTFDLYGPVTLPHDCKYYGENGFDGTDIRAEYMVVDACRLLNDQIDFSKYDTDGDGRVDNVYIIYAGPAESAGASAHTIWPHQYELSKKNLEFDYDGVTIDHYGCCNEATLEGTPQGIGTFCHEFSHVLGLPDLYNTVTRGLGTPSFYSIMDVGSYLNESRTPPTYSAFERNALGWIKPKPLDGRESVSLQHILLSNEARIVNTERDNEFFLIEQRLQRGWDRYLPNQGMLVWHIDYDPKVWYDLSVNNDPSHQYVDLVEAGGVIYDDNDWNILRSYPFPGTAEVTEFSAATTPAFKSWSSKPMEYPITNIAINLAGILTFDVLGGVFDLDAPQLRLTETTPGGFTLEWDAVSKAKEYFVTVARVLPEGDEVVASYNDLSVGESTMFVAERLDGNTTYRASVYAFASFNYSPVAELEITTAPVEFGYIVPVIAAASDVNINSFTANWLPVEDATCYLLNVDVHVVVPGTVVTMDFSNKYGNYALPEGWESNSDSYYSSSSKGYIGESAPAGKLTKDQNYVQTAVFPDDVMSLQMWLRQSGSSTDNGLIVDGRVDENSEWIQLVVHKPLVSASGGETWIFDDMPAGIRQLRFTYMRPKVGNLAIDDIKITLVGNGYENWIADRKVSATSCRVEDVPEDVTSLRYTVVAENAQGEHTLVSDPMIVDLTGQGGVSSAVAESSAAVTVVDGVAFVSTLPGTRVNVYDVAGRLVASAVAAADGVASVSLEQGFYVIAGQKVVVK